MLNILLSASRSWGTVLPDFDLMNSTISFSDLNIAVGGFAAAPAASMISGSFSRLPLASNVMVFRFSRNQLNALPCIARNSARPISFSSWILLTDNRDRLRSNH